MRIGSTEASNLNTTLTQDQKAVPQSSPAVAKENKESAFMDAKRVSQMSEYEKKELPIPERVVIDAIEKANKAISVANRKFEYSIHEKTKEIMIKVIDTDTNQVVREIPPEKILDMVAKMWEMAGLMVDERR